MDNMTAVKAKKILEESIDKILSKIQEENYDSITKINKIIADRANEGYTNALIDFDIDSSMWNSINTILYYYELGGFKVDETGFREVIISWE